MCATFSGCSSLTNVNLIIGNIKIDANVNGSIIDNIHDYTQCFREISTNGRSLIISKNSTCSILEIILNTKSINSNITLEE